MIGMGLLRPSWPHPPSAQPKLSSIIHAILIYWISISLTTKSKAASSSPICTFESSCPQWSFLNSEELITQQKALLFPNSNASENVVAKSSNNFYVVLSGRGNASNHYAYYQAMLPSNQLASGHARHRPTTTTLSPDAQPIVAMLVSPHFERTSPQCELHFRYRVLGAAGAELLVASEQLSLRLLHPDMPVVPAYPMEDEDEDWTRPTLRAHFEPGNPPLGAGEPWAHARVSLGQFNFPTRIRVECHPSTDKHQVEDVTGEATLSVECSVDDLQLVNCAEEEWHSAGDDGDCPEGRIPCRPFGGGQRAKICLRDDQLCDMHPDCADGEDELEQLHRCSQVPEGARCDFEDLRWLPAGCAHWRFFSSQAGGQPNSAASNGTSTSALTTGSQSRLGQAPLQHLVSLADAQTRRPGIPPGEYFLEGRLYRPGHFLFFSSYDHAQSGQHDIVYSFALSPPLPPLQSTGVPLRQCSLRFFYCLTGFSPFQVFLQRRDQPQEMAKPLWAPPRDEHVREPCEWRRAAVHVEASTLAAGGEYSLKLSFAKLAGSLGSIAVDDLSLSPECFANGARSSLLPAKLSISADEELGQEKKEEVSGQLLRWIVPSSGEYHLELAGAAGGTFPGNGPHRRDTWADRFVAIVRLVAGQQVAVLLGQSGQCICDLDAREFGPRRELAELHEQLCSAANRALLLQQEEEGEDMFDLSTLPGCGGGGASLFLLGNSPLAVAAGGGGDFPGRTILVDLDEEVHPASTASSSGRGLSLGRLNIGGKDQQQQQHLHGHCLGHACMDGHVGANWSQLLGGKCPNGPLAFAGGRGGGGAACGPGGGGGAGLEGGTAGFLSPGMPGTSGMFRPKGLEVLGTPLQLAKSNPGQGFLRLHACPQRECPPRANCTFGWPQGGEGGTEPVAFCICPDGRRTVPPNGSCQTEPSLFTRLINGNLQRPEPVPSLLLLACFLLLLLSILLTFLCLFQLIRCFRRRQKLRGCPSADVHELIAIAAESGTGPAAGEGTHRHYGISGNPIYESLNLNPLPKIPRHALRLEKIIGHGAFGEVFEGWLLLSEGGQMPNGQKQVQQAHQQQNQQQSVKVAVKSLPVESANDFGDDFEMEARLLSQFKHENIVTFFGVSFEQQPKYIVLEFLEGGDLKNFLRENRPRQDQDASLKMGDLMGFALDVARGCEHLEATRFVHRDIAARNCLLTAKVGRRVVKIADFGMARDIYRNDYYRKGGKAFLPVRWMPPESFLDGLFTSKTDVWAFGVLLWEIFSMGYIPYSGRENHEVMRLVVAGDRLDPPIGVPSEVYELMLCCWHTEAERRPKFAELIGTFEQLLKREDLIGEPLPPIRHRLANERSVSATPSMSRAGDPHPASTTSQATVSTALSSSAQEGGGGGGCASSTTTSTYESMPTAGDGVCRAVFPPYQSRQPEEGALMRMEGPSSNRQSGSSSSSDSQDETLHESAGTVKLRNCIRPRPPPLTLRPSPTMALRPAMASSPLATMPQQLQIRPMCSMPQSPAGGASQWRRPSNASPSQPPQPQQSHRNHSLPPLPCCGTPAEHREDQDSGIASARSIASADAALTLLTAAMEERQRRTAEMGGRGE